MSERKPGNSENSTSESMAEPAWEQWQLTAFVLGELEEPLQRRIAEQARQDFALRSELKSIKAMLSEVKQVLRSEPTDHSGPHSDAAREHRLQAIFAQADQAENSGAATVPLRTTVQNEGNRPAWIGVLAMSACLMIAAWLSLPALTNWVTGVSEPKLASGSPGDADPDLSDANDSDLPTNPNSDSPNESPIPAAEHGERADAELDDPSLGGESDPMEQWMQIVESGRTGIPIDPSAATIPMNPSKAGAVRPIAEGNLLAGDPAAGGLGSAQGGMGGAGYGGGGYGGMGGYGAGSHDSSPLPGGAFGGVVQLDGSGGDPKGKALGQYVDMGARRERGLRSQLFPLQVREKELRNALGENHPSVRLIRQRIVEVQSQLDWIEEAPGVDSSGDRLRSSGDRFEMIYENRFERVSDFPLSTFSADVDTASFSKVRQYLLQSRQLPPVDAVRMEEFVNYFDYEYAGPENDGEPFGVALAVAECPWNLNHQLVRIAMQTERMQLAERPKANLVFLLDVSGSMDEPGKLPLVRESMRMLAQQLNENDRVAIVVYAGAAGCILEPTRGDQQQEIREALDLLRAGGSTNGGDGIRLAYDLARDTFIDGGINRVVLCTDGDFNVGVADTTDLVNLVEENAKSNVFLTVLGFGMGNTNDEMMEQISNHGNGVYGFVDSRREAHRQMVKQLDSNLVTVAKDVKIQVEFNPQRIRSYRLLGYENRQLADADFENDRKDAGEIGAGHRVTALYEVVPVDRQASGEDAFSKLRYRGSQPNGATSEDSAILPYLDELLAVKLRYKLPEATESRLMVVPFEQQLGEELDESDRDFRWAAAMVEFGMLLRDSRYLGSANWSGLLERATSAAGVSPDADRQECLEMIRTAAALQYQRLTFTTVRTPRKKAACKCMRPFRVEGNWGER